MSFQVHRAVIGEEAALRAVQLQALADSLQFFCTSYERELAFTSEDWRRWITGGGTFLLESGGETRGLVSSKSDSQDPKVIHLLAMWVHPELRGSGAAAALIAAVKKYAADSGATRVRLGIVEGNSRAALLRTGRISPDRRPPRAGVQHRPRNRNDVRPYRAGDWFLARLRRAGYKSVTLLWCRFRLFSMSWSAKKVARCDTSLDCVARNS
jgi:GNAT superfamily N-acetyltransferase